MSRVQSNGLSIEVETNGDESDVPLLLISGFGSQLISWPTKMIDALTGAGFFVVAMDNRDAGLSEKLSEVGVQDRGSEGSEHEQNTAFGDNWHRCLARLARRSLPARRRSASATE